LNFGATEAAAKANTGPQVVLMPRPSDDIADTMPHLIFNVDDIHQAMAAIKTAGGVMQTETPVSIPDGGATIMIAIARDPAGNPLELIQTGRP